MKHKLIALLALISTSVFADDSSRLATEKFVTQKVDEARAIVALWEAYIGGSNVVFAVTNYISGSYPLTEGKFKLKEFRDGKYRTLYDSHIDITNHLGNFQATVINPALTNLANSVAMALEDKADKAWGKYTSAGEVNEMTNAVWMTHQETVFGGGSEWKRVSVGEGSIAVLTTSGMVTHSEGTEGKFFFSDFGYTNKFGFATTSSYTIGAFTDGIEVDNANGIVALRYDITMNGTPCIWYAPTLEKNADGMIEWEMLNNSDGTPVEGASHTVSFDTSQPEKVFAFLNVKGEKMGFFRATIEQAGSAKFFSSMPADFEGGILCTDGQNKVKIDWNNGNPRLIPFTE
jgi:hypothetical protein